ncbi:FumA C-terminus/TtdB family hydratase beta subunit [archaeon]|nr:FumA C-terminus/TtdB family hydratase beta subunit [archaeon]
MNIELPLKDARDLKLGDIVTLSGELITMRDRASRRAAENGEVPAPAHTVYHCGPLVKNGSKVVSAGPTTSARLNDYTRTMAEKFGTRIFIGKGGMSRESGKVFEEFGCAYLAFTGGAGALAARGIKEVKAVLWEDLGMAEAVWQLLVEDFGPLVVAMDATAGSLYK